MTNFTNIGNTISKDRLFELLDEMIEWDNESLDRILQQEGYRSEDEEREVKNYFKHTNEGYVRALKTVKSIVTIWGTSADALKEEVEDND